MHISSSVKVYLALDPTDMRKSINGLSILVEDQLDLNPFSGHLFAFANRARTIVKVLYYDRNGFALWMKRLEKHNFKWPCSESEVMEIGHRELSWLLEGLEVQQKYAHERLEYSAIF